MIGCQLIMQETHQLSILSNELAIYIDLFILFNPSLVDNSERPLPRSRIAKSAIQLQPTMMAMRWSRPVGDPGRTPFSSRADTVVEAMKKITTRVPVMWSRVPSPSNRDHLRIAAPLQNWLSPVS